MTQIEDTAGNTAEAIASGEIVELAIASDSYSIVEAEDVVTTSLILTPRQARALARRLLAQADAAEYGDEG